LTFFFKLNINNKKKDFLKTNLNKIKHTLAGDEEFWGLREFLRKQQKYNLLFF
jgi:hypothetical protein